MNNVYLKFCETVQKSPQKKALIIPGLFSDKEFNFDDLYKKTLGYQNFFFQKGIRENDLVAIFLSPGVEFIACTFALFSLGATPLFMDPGMGIKKVLKNLRTSGPKVIIAENIVLGILIISPKIPSLRFTISKNQLQMIDEKSSPLYFTSQNNQAAILFTSGATGPPKGVCYTHQMFLEQIKQIQNYFKIKTTDIDYPAFPLFALFTLCMGVTVVIPSINPTRPGSCSPKKVLTEIKKYKVTILSGSPAIWDVVSSFQKANPHYQNNCNEVKTVIMFGAPVSTKIHQTFLPYLPNGDIFTPYGATESLPVSCASGRQILNNYSSLTEIGAGTFIGKVFPHVRIKILPYKERLAINKNLKKPLEFGELWVSSLTTSKEYLKLPEENKLSKMKDEDGTIWHKMGDLAAVDEQNNLWFHGRIPHAMKINQGIYTSISCEEIFNQHKDTKRSALIQLNSGKMAVVIESPTLFNSNLKKRLNMKKELKSLAKNYSHTETIEHFYFSKKFPVDIRHNIKINREELKQMAQEGKLL